MKKNRDESIGFKIYIYIEMSQGVGTSGRGEDTRKW
jgi:hypothetical protein